jgi:hypothetical protein
MGKLGIIAVLPPQLLLLLVFGNYFNLLGDWVQTISGLRVLVGLFVAGPILALVWLVALAVSNWRGRSRGSARKPLWPAVLLLVQAVVVDLSFLSQMQMHM